MFDPQAHHFPADLAKLQDQIRKERQVRNPNRKLFMAVIIAILACVTVIIAGINAPKAHATPVPSASAAATQATVASVAVSSTATSSNLDDTVDARKASQASALALHQQEVAKAEAAAAARQDAIDNHVVVDGDSLYKIAGEAADGNTWETLYKRNPQVQNPNVILRGWIIHRKTPVLNRQWPPASSPVATPSQNTSVVSASKPYDNGTQQSANSSAPSNGNDWLGGLNWDGLADCESSNRWNINTGNGYYGGLQFDIDTWLGNGGGKYAPRADLATKAQQIQIAYALYQRRGAQPWTCGYRLTQGVRPSTTHNVAPAAYVVPAPQAPAQSSSRAQTVVNFAWSVFNAHLPYELGASGPGAYDCSGLVVAAFAKIGIALPHRSEDQYAYGTYVAAYAWQPGDLVFFEPTNSGPDHVGIYVGNDMMIAAADAAEGIKFQKVYGVGTGEYVGAKRLI